MKKWLGLLIFVPSFAFAQADPTGFSTLLVQEAKNVQGGGSIRFSDGKVGSVGFLAIKTFHTADNSLNWLLLNVGAESLKGEALNAIIFPSTDLVGLTNYLFFKNNWSNQHVTGSGLPPIQVGAGPAIPLNYGLVKSWHWSDIGRAIHATVSVRFGDVVK